MKQKKHYSLCLAWCCLLCLLTGLLAAVPASAEDGCSLRVSADRDTADTDDEILLTVTLGPVRWMGTMAFVIEIPDGLAYVPGSGQLAPELADTLGFDNVTFTEASMLLNGYASRADYESDGDTVLMTFRCRVTAAFSGTCEVTLSHLEFYSCRTWQNHTAEYRVIPAMISSSCPTAAESGTAEDATEATAPEPDTQPDTESETRPPQTAEPQPTVGSPEPQTEPFTEREADYQIESVLPERETQTEAEPDGEETVRDSPAPGGGCVSSAVPASAAGVLLSAAVLSVRRKRRTFNL